jgi:hypothetical protein
MNEIELFPIDDADVFNGIVVSVKFSLMPME